MAEKRMFAKKIIDSDEFMDMPLSAQALYYHLSMRADDDGFITNSKKMQRMLGTTTKDLNLLIKHGFLLAFDSGVLVVTHWNVHNSIRSDRRKASLCKAEKEMLKEVDGVYMFRTADDYATEPGCQPNDNQVTDNWQPTDSQLTAQNRLDENRLDKNRLDKFSAEQNNIITTTTTGEAADEVIVTCGEIPTNAVSLKRATDFITALTKRYWNSIPTKYDIEQAFTHLYQYTILDEDNAIGIYDETKAAMLEQAFQLAASNGKNSWHYIEAIYDKWERNGITSEEAVIQHEFERVRQKMAM